MTTAYVALGSNVGDRLGYLQGAVSALRTGDGIRVMRSSSVYETEPLGPPQGLYLNAVVEIETTLGPHELLEALKDIERALGRKQRERWGPREIDLDLLLYGDESIDEPDLVVPHPEMHRRPFVLIPLEELGVDSGNVVAAGVRKIDAPLVSSLQEP